MSPNNEKATSPSGDGKSYTRRRNMKKLNRAGRLKLKRKKEVIAAAEASGEDVEEALRKAGLLEKGPDKTNASEKTSDSDIPQVSETSSKKAKAKMRIEQLKASKRQKKALDVNSNDNKNHRDYWADLLFESFKSASKHAHRASSGFVPSAIHPASPVQIARLEHALTQKETRATGLSVVPSELARPKVIFISPSALGALDCLKNCQGLHKGCPFAKLFAKHMKVAEQAAYLQQHPVNLALGTPNRLLKLATEGHLDVSGVSVIVLDMRKNPKQQSLVDIPDVAGDWWGFWERFFVKEGRDEVQILIVDDE